jgi:membrane-bound serine protease (ClpP class)
VLGIGGVAAFAFGALLLIDTETPAYGIPLPLVAGLAVVSALVVTGVVGMAAKARRRPVVSGAPTLLGRAAVVIDSDADGGWALVNGERWRVRSLAPLHVGQQVVVTAIDQLTLQVTPMPDSHTPQGASS